MMTGRMGNVFNWYPSLRWYAQELEFNSFVLLVSKGGKNERSPSCFRRSNQIQGTMFSLHSADYLPGYLASVQLEHVRNTSLILETLWWTRVETDLGRILEISFKMFYSIYSNIFNSCTSELPRKYLVILLLSDLLMLGLTSSLLNNFLIDLNTIIDRLIISYDVGLMQIYFVSSV